jgi:hypothetical protein
MRGWFSCLCWGVAGAFVGGWASALLSEYAIIEPTCHLLGGGATGSMLVDMAHHAHALVLTGMLMGAASGVCLARYLCFRPVVKMDPEVAPVAVGLLAPLLLLLPSLGVFGGSLVGLQIDRSGATVVAMDVSTPERRPTVTESRRLGPTVMTHGYMYASYNDRHVVVTMRCRYHPFPWR